MLDQPAGCNHVRGRRFSPAKLRIMAAMRRLAGESAWRKRLPHASLIRELAGGIGTNVSDHWKIFALAEFEAGLAFFPGTGQAGCRSTPPQMSYTEKSSYGNQSPCHGRPWRRHRPGEWA